MDAEYWAKKKETDNDIGELHTRIDKIVDKVQDTEVKLLKQIADVKECITKHNKEEKEQLDSILRWKWMVAGGIIAISWLISHVGPDTISRFLGK